MASDGRPYHHEHVSPERDHVYLGGLQDKSKQSVSKGRQKDELCKTGGKNGKAKGKCNSIEATCTRTTDGVLDGSCEYVGDVRDSEGEDRSGTRHETPKVTPREKVAADDLFYFIERKGCVIERDELKRFYRGHKDRDGKKGHTSVIFQDHQRSDKDFLDLFPHMFKHDENEVELVVEWLPGKSIEEMIEKRFGIAYALCVALPGDVNYGDNSENSVSQIIEKSAAIELPCHPYYDEVRREYIVACSRRADVGKLRECTTLDVRPFLVWPKGVKVSEIHDRANRKDANVRDIIINDKLMAYLHKCDFCGDGDTEKDVAAKIETLVNIKLPVLPMKGCSAGKPFAFVACRTEGDRKKMIDSLGHYGCKPKGRNVPRGNHKCKADPNKRPVEQFVDAFREWDAGEHRIHIQVDLESVASQINGQAKVKKYPDIVSRIHKLIDALKAKGWRPRKDGGYFVEFAGRDANKTADWLAERVIEEKQDIQTCCDGDALREANLASSCKIKVFVDGAERNTGTIGSGSVAGAAWVGYIREINGVPHTSHQSPFAEVGKYLGNVTSTVAEYRALELALQDIVNILAI
eukprot:TRINITY_DN55989_c0_g1_i1.p1 TRINITY_DN55989_c0_g1~~TRINITY_DN55989_c0_g1_i1.p1  ORF type:complete len:578 (+),score=59.85 TRINITY_DN55989_c0_g1_i1:75-1808(+)